jgi:IS605 OrfB family transposase
MKKAYFSHRVYKDTLPDVFVEAISHSLHLFNRSKHYAYQTQVLENRSGETRRKQSLHVTVKSRFEINDYYANSAVQEANAHIKSQNELTKMYVTNKKEQIKSVKNKMKSTKSRLTTLVKIKASIVKGKPRFNKTSREQKKGNFFVVQFKNKTDIYYHEYQFEHEYVDVQIMTLKSRLGYLEFRLDRLQKQLDSLERKYKSAVFGTKKLFKGQHTLPKYQDNHDLWLQDWNESRYNQMTISGRKDAKYGNFVFSYEPETKSLHFMTPDGVAVEIENLLFPYGQENIDCAIDFQLSTKDKKKHGNPIAWSVEDHGDYYIFKCILDIPENESINHSRSNGLLGVDLNVDHIAWSDINSIGQLIKSDVFEFDLEGKTTGQSIKIIEAEAIRLVDLALKLNKPIGIEKLDTTKSKVSNPYGNKKANRKMSAFAYAKMITAIKNRADKMGVAVFEVNPAYTSQIAKMKYMKRLGISIHQAASFVIARRAMGFKETLPPVLHSLLPEKMTGLHHWAQWKYISNLLKSIRVCAFYQSELFDLAKFYHSGELFVAGAITDLEQKSLAKVISRKSIS